MGDRRSRLSAQIQSPRPPGAPVTENSSLGKKKTNVNFFCFDNFTLPSTSSTVARRIMIAPQPPKPNAAMPARRLSQQNAHVPSVKSSFNVSPPASSRSQAQAEHSQGHPTRTDLSRKPPPSIPISSLQGFNALPQRDPLPEGAFGRIAIAPTLPLAAPPLPLPALCPSADRVTTRLHPPSIQISLSACRIHRQTEPAAPP